MGVIVKQTKTLSLTQSSQHLLKERKNIMNQKTTIILSTIVTTFSLVVLGGVAGRVSSPVASLTPNTAVSAEQAPAQNANYVPEYQVVPAQAPGS